MARRYSSNPSGNMLNIFIVVLIVAVIALGVVATWDKVSTGIRQYNVNNGGEYTVAEVADQSGMEVSDFLDYYGIVEGDGITGESNLSAMGEKLTLENYSKLYFGEELTDDVFAEFKTAKGIGDDVAKDTKDMEVKTKYSEYEYEKQAAEAAASAAPADDTLTIPADDTAETPAETAVPEAE